MENQKPEGWFKQLRNSIKEPKSLSDLIVEEKFLVKLVKTTQKEKNLMIDLNNYNKDGVILNPEYGQSRYALETLDPDENKITGIFTYETTTYLDVVPLNKDCPIVKLIFEGETPIVGGNIINAKILKYDTRILRSEARARKEKKEDPYELGFYFGTKTIHIEKPYGVEESALELKLYGSNNSVIRIDESRKYNSI